jgi:hypothetical protein
MTPEHASSFRSKLEPDPGILQAGVQFWSGEPHPGGGGCSSRCDGRMRFTLDPERDGVSVYSLNGIRTISGPERPCPVAREMGLSRCRVVVH